jgi:hypothetical protein
VLGLAGAATAFATGLGAVPVFLLGDRATRLRPFLSGTTVGLMGVASVVGLLLPALDEDGGATVAAGLLVGIVFCWAPGAFSPNARFTSASWAAQGSGRRCPSLECCSCTAFPRIRDRDRVRIRHRRPRAVHLPGDRAAERPRGDERRRRHRLPGGGGNRRTAPILIRLRRRRDARARDRGAHPGGLFEGRPAHGRRRAPQPGRRSCCCSPLRWAWNSAGQSSDRRKGPSSSATTFSSAGQGLSRLTSDSTRPLSIWAVRKSGSAPV